MKSLKKRNCVWIIIINFIAALGSKQKKKLIKDINKCSADCIFESLEYVKNNLLIDEKGMIKCEWVHSLFSFCKNNNVTQEDFCVIAILIYDEYVRNDELKIFHRHHPHSVEMRGQPILQHD